MTQYDAEHLKENVLGSDKMTTPEKTLKDVMPKGEWDWFGTYNCAPEKRKFYVTKDKLAIDYQEWEEVFSLADLLANKSWCKAMWGEKEDYCTNQHTWGKKICLHCGVDTTIQPPKDSGCNHVHYPEECEMCNKKNEDYRLHSSKAFQIFQQEDKQACINYIYQTKLCQTTYQK
jgi:hypothetical protein